MSTQRSTLYGGWRGPNIVEEGLVLYLNADSLNSYNTYFPSNTWRDISGKGYDANLLNGPTFVNENGGGILFDGTDDYGRGTNSLSTEITNSITIISCSKISNLNSRSFIFSKFDNVSGAKYGFEVGTVPGLWTRTMRWYANGSINQTSTNDYRGSVQLNSNQTYMFTLTYNNATTATKMYYNNIEMPATQAGTNIVHFDWASKNINYQIASLRPFFTIPTSSATMYNCLVYNRDLSFNEILVNYNAFKPIYNI